MKESSTSRKGKHKHSKAKTSKKSQGATVDTTSDTHMSTKSSSHKESEERNTKDLILDEKTIAMLPDELKPLSCFVDDKQKFFDELFRSVPESVLTKIVPEALKAYNLTALKKLCLDELMPMSEELIQFILQGNEPSNFVDTVTLDIGPVDESEATYEKSLSKSDTTSILKRKHCLDDIALEEQEETSNDAKRSAIIDTDAEISIPDALFEIHPTSNELESMDLIDKTENSPIECNEGTDFELLELTLRARAIRSFLKAKGLPSDEEEPEE